MPARLGVGVLRAAHADGVAAAAGGGKKKKKKKGKAAATVEAAEAAAAGEAEAAAAFDALLLLGGSDKGMEAQLETGHAWAEERGLAPGGEGCGGGCVLLNGLLLRGSLPTLKASLHRWLRAEARRLRPSAVAGAYNATRGAPLADQVLMSLAPGVTAAGGGGGSGLGGSVLGGALSRPLLARYSHEALAARGAAVVRAVLDQADSGEAAEEEQAAAQAGAARAARGRAYVSGVEARAVAAAAVLTEVWARGAPRYAPHPEVAACALTCVKLRGVGEAAALHVHAVLDPLSEMARWAAPLLVALRAQIKLSLTVDGYPPLHPALPPCSPAPPTPQPRATPWSPPCPPAAPRWSSRHSPSCAGCRSRACTDWPCSSSPCAPRRPPPPSSRWIPPP